MHHLVDDRDRVLPYVAMGDFVKGTLFCLGRVEREQPRGGHIG